VVPEYLCSWSNCSTRTRFVWPTSLPHSGRLLGSLLSRVWSSLYSCWAVPVWLSLHSSNQIHILDLRILPFAKTRIFRVNTFENANLKSVALWEFWTTRGRGGCARGSVCGDIGTFAASRETEPYGGARERSLHMLLRKRCYADGNCLLAQLLTSAEILAQNRENLRLNWFISSQSRYVANWLYADLRTRSISRNIIHWLASHRNLTYWAIGWHAEVHNRVHHSCQSQFQKLRPQFCANNVWYMKYVVKFICFTCKIMSILYWDIYVSRSLPRQKLIRIMTFLVGLVSLMWNIEDTEFEFK
jgi:hypothetical protein